MKAILREHFRFLWSNFAVPEPSPSAGLVWKGQEICLPAGMFSVLVLPRPVSGDVKAGLSLHHSRHLNPFALVAFYSAFTAAQVFNIDQSPLLSSSFITSPSRSPTSSSSFSLLQSPAVTLCFPTMFLTLPSISSFPSPTRFLSSSPVGKCAQCCWLCGRRGHT